MKKKMMLYKMYNTMQEERSVSFTICCDLRLNMLPYEELCELRNIVNAEWSSRTALDAAQILNQWKLEDKLTRTISYKCVELDDAWGCILIVSDGDNEYVVHGLAKYIPGAKRRMKRILAEEMLNMLKTNGMIDGMIML